LRRLRRLISTCVAAAIVIAAAIAISRSSGSDLKAGAAAQHTIAAVARLLDGIPQSGARLGRPNAPVRMLLYSDLQCPVCSTFAQSDGFARVVARQVRAGKLQIVYRNLQTATHDPHTFLTQQVAALAAGLQNRFWDYAELFYRQQGSENGGYVTAAYLLGLARQVPGLDLTRWRADRTDPALAGQVSADSGAAHAAGVSVTPTLIFQGPRGAVRLPEAIPTYAQLEQALQAVA
jgi:protein-disulfide isomerase